MNDHPLSSLLSGFLKPYRREILLCILLTLSKAMIAVFIPYCFKLILDQFIPLKDIASIYMWSIIAALSIIMNFIVERTRTRLSGKFSNLIRADIRKSIVEQLQRLRYGFFHGKTYGETNTNILQDVDSFGNALFERMLNSINHCLYFGLTFVLLLNADPVLSVVIYLFIGLMVWIIGRLKRVMSHYSKEFAVARSDFHVLLSDFSHNLKLIRSYAIEDQIMNQLKEKNKIFIRRWLATNIFGPAIQSSIELATWATYLMAFIIGSRAMYNGTLTAGGLLLFLSYLPQVWSRFGSLTDLYYGYLDAKVYAHRIFGILKLETEEPQQEALDAGSISFPIDRIQLKNITFRYPGQNRPVYSQLSYEFNKPGLYAIIGESGSGKSTLFELLLRFYHVDEGEIVVGEHNIKQYHLTELRKQIGIIHQEIFLMEGTIMENIVFGEDGITRQKVELTSKLLGFHTHLCNLEYGYDTRLAVRGENLSTGQQRMVSILRILCRNPDIILFDEVTSNIDSFTEQLLHRTLKVLASDKICIMITHKQNDVEIADHVLRLVTTTGLT